MNNGHRSSEHVLTDPGSVGVAKEQGTRNPEDAGLNPAGVHHCPGCCCEVKGEGVDDPMGEYALELEAVNVQLVAACKWLVEYHEGSGPIVGLDEYLSRAKAAIAFSEAL